MRKLSLLVLALSVPFFAACDSNVMTSPDDDTLRAETADRSITAMDQHGADVEQQLQAVRRATVAFHDPAAAETAGYHMEEECISAASVGAPAELGAMGYHFVNPALVDGTFEPTKPEALVYEKRGDGSLHLVAVEYLFVGEEAPEFADTVHFHEFLPPFADFALHAWVWQGNPNGTFAEFNPNVSCPTE